MYRDKDSSSIVRLGILAVMLFCVWQFVLTPSQQTSLRSSVNSLSQRVESRATAAPLATAEMRLPARTVTVPTAVRVTANGTPIVTPAVCGPSVPSTTACVLPVGGAVLPTATQLPTYVECSPGSYYSCEDLEKFRDQSRTVVASGEGDDKDLAVVTADAFISATPVVQPELQDAYRKACADTPKDKRDGFLTAICEGAGL